MALRAVRSPAAARVPSVGRAGHRRPLVVRQALRRRRVRPDADDPVLHGGGRLALVPLGVRPRDPPHAGAVGPAGAGAGPPPPGPRPVAAPSLSKGQKRAVVAMCTAAAVAIAL